MKNLKPLLMALVLFAMSHPGHAEEVTTRELMNMIKEMQEQLAQQATEINALKAELKEQKQSPIQLGNTTSKTGDSGFMETQKPVDNDTELPGHGYAAIKEVAGFNLSKGISGINLKGDIRLRHERQEIDKAAAGADSEKNRNRIRLRLGAVWTNPGENWEIGLGLATGKDSDPISTNDTFSETNPFDHSNINLDYAYIRNSWDDLDLILGQQINPFESTLILMDADVRPVGIAGKYSIGNVFATAGVFDVFEFGSNEGQALLYAAQGGYKMKTDDMEIVAAIGYYWYNNPTTETNAGSTSVNAPGIPNSISKHYDFHIGDLYTHVKTTIEDVDIKAYGQLDINFGADGNLNEGQLPGTATDPIVPDKNDLAYILGIEGNAGPVKLGLAYGRIEADSVYAPIKDSDFGATAGLPAVDFKGYIANIGYEFAKSMTLGLTYMDIERIAGPADEAKLYQLDLVYKF